MNVHEVTLMKAHLRTLRGYKRRLGGGEGECGPHFRMHRQLSVAYISQRGFAEIRGRSCAVLAVRFKSPP